MENGRSQLQQVQEDVEEVKGIMLVNLNKAGERSDKLDELETRADDLLVKAKGFQKTTAKVKQKKRWDNMKMKVVLIAMAVVVGLIILGLIIAAIVPDSQDTRSSATPSPMLHTPSGLSEHTPQV